MENSYFFWEKAIHYDRVVARSSKFSTGLSTDKQLIQVGQLQLEPVFPQFPQLAECYDIFSAN